MPLVDTDFGGRRHKIGEELEGGCENDLWVGIYRAFAVHELFQSYMILWFI